MEAMNKWLAFSLSGGGGHRQPEPQPPASIQQGISDWTSADHGAGETNCRTIHQYSSESSSSGDQLAMLMSGPAPGSSSCSNNRINSSMIPELYDQPDAPKLENFLGLHPFAAAHCNNPYTDGSTSRPNYLAHYSLTDNAAAETNPCVNLPRNNNHPNSGGGGSSSSIGLSMIKSWLRNQPLGPPAGVNEHGISSTAMDARNKNLTLSMSAEGELQSLSSSGAPLSLHAPAISHGAGTSPLVQSDHDHDNISNNNDSDKLQQDSSSSCAVEPVPRRSLDTFGQRTSIYRGVTRHRWTGRYEAHLWDNSCRREGQTRKGRQVYLGGYDKEEKAARAYDLAALKYWGTTTTTNFPISNYQKELEEMKHMTRQEFIASLRRKSSGFSRGASIYRGVTRHHQHGRWQARIGRVAGNKDLYLGTFSTQEEAAEAYDIAAIKFRGLNAVTNFDMSRYDVKSILESATLPVGAARRLKDVAYHQGQGQGQGQGLGGQGQGHHRGILTDILQGADFPRTGGSLMSTYENHGGGSGSGSAMATVLGGIHSYAEAAAGWPSMAGSFPQAPLAGQIPLYGFGHGHSQGQSVMHRNWGCKQEQPEQEADGGGTSVYTDHRRHHFSSLGMGSTTHNFFQQLDSGGGGSMAVLPPSYLMNSAASATTVSNPDFHVLSNAAYASDAAEYGGPITDHHDQESGSGHHSVMYGSTVDQAAAAYGTYQSQHSMDGSGSDRYVSWVPTGIPVAAGSSANASSRAPRVGNMSMPVNHHGAPTFTVWPPE